VAFDEGIASRSSRPYASTLPTHALSHYLRGSPHSRLAAPGYGQWHVGGEHARPQSASVRHDLASNSSSRTSTAVSTSRCEFTHYANVMNGRFPQGRYRRLGNERPYPSGDRLLLLIASARSGDSTAATLYILARASPNDLIRRRKWPPQLTDKRQLPSFRTWW